MATAQHRAARHQRLQSIWLHRDAAALALWPLSCLFGLLARARRGLFRAGLLRSERLPVPVWVVGNLVVGGAGKTPTVLALCRWLQRQGRQPGIISRGYGGQADRVREVLPDSPAGEVGDEPLLLRWRSGVPVFVGRRRVEAGRALLKRHPEIDIIVCDDGLQHLRLRRDFQIILFDARGAGNGWLLPAGPLREPVPARVPERSVVAYNHVAASTHLPGCVLETRLAGAVRWEDWRQGRPATAEALAALADSSRVRPVWAAAGIAQPGRFFSMLEGRGLRIRPLALPDHHDYTGLPWPGDAADVLVTEKDAVKLGPTTVAGATRVWVVPLDLHWNADLDATLLGALGSPAASHPD